VVTTSALQKPAPQFGSELLVEVPEIFNFSECLKFLDRNRNECLHKVDGDCWMKLVELDQQLVLMVVSMSAGYLKVHTPELILSDSQQSSLLLYVSEVFELNTDLQPFYDQMKGDPLMEPLCKRFHGLRLIGIPDLFEALCWCVIGQQINLHFAYQLKKRLVQAKGKRLRINGTDYFTFPDAEVIAEMTPGNFSKWQFSLSKAKYIVGIARAVVQNQITKSMLMDIPKEEAMKTLIGLKGVGPWSAEYVMMKCCRNQSAFPIDDVGLHNAVKIQRGLDRKPTKPELLKLQQQWNPWQAYATFYLWHSLILD
jgi:DNA-3-methyladenine glycosylase II